MNKIVLLFSHKLLDEQIKELKEKFNIGKIIYLNEELQNYWTNVDVENNYVNNFNKIKEFIASNLEIGDYILIQGEWGYTYNMIEYAKQKEYIPIYSFSKRKSMELKKGNQIIKKSIFKHILFLKY